MLHLYYGRESRDAYAFFFSRFGSGFHTLIVPEQFTHQAEERAIAAFGSTGLMDTEIVSFPRLTRRIIEETGGNTRVPLTEDGRRMLLSRILREKEDGLDAFRKLTRRAGFTETLDGMLSEFKQYGTSPEAIREAAEDPTNPAALRRKLADLAVIYAAYEDAVRDTYLDGEDTVRFAVSRSPEAPCITDRTFWILGFDPFSPMIEELFSAILRYAKDVHLAITADPETDRDRDLFRLSVMFAEREKALARSLGVPVTEEAIPEAFERSRPAALKHLESELFRLRPAEWPEEAPEIAFAAAASPFAEVEACAAAIRGLVRDEGYRYREIAVLTNDMDGRGKLAKRVFAEYGIPVFLDEKKRILQNPAVVFVTALLDSWKSALPEDVFRLLKTGFCDIDPNDLEYLENYAIKYHIRGGAWKKPFRYGATERASHRFVYGEEGMARLNAIRETVAALLSSFEEAYGSAKTAAEKTRALYRFLAEDAALPARIDALRDGLTARGRLEEAEELRQVWDAVTDVLEQLVELTADEEIAADEYKELLEAGLASKEIGLIPPAVDQVVVGPARRLATGDLKALFVIGANEGVLPAESGETDLLSPEERKTLLAKDRTFCRDGGWIAEEETLALYRDFAKPAERLRVSFARADSAGEDARASDVYRRMRRMFPRNAERSCQLSVDESLQTVRASLPHLAAAFAEERKASAAGRPGGEAREEFGRWKEAYDWFLENEPEATAPVREGLLFQTGSERVLPGTADRLFPKTLSPSRLEQYSHCPFAHFVRYGLEPEERRSFETDFRSVGDVAHEVLMELSKRLSTTGKDVTDPASKWMTVTEAELEELTGAIFEEETGRYREGLFGAGEAELYRKERIRAVLFETAKELVRQVRSGSIERMALEEPFKRTAELPPIPVETPAGTVFIEGRIDRVDELPGGYVKIIDYKTGENTFSPDDARSGWRLQLMLYLAAATQERNGEPERTPAGALYFRIADYDINIAGIEGALADVVETRVAPKLREAFAMNGIVLDDPEVLNSIVGDADPKEVVGRLGRKKDGSFTGNALIDETDFRNLLNEVKTNVAALCAEMFNGNIAAEPLRYGKKTACENCAYKAICRFR